MQPVLDNAMVGVNFGRSGRFLWPDKTTHESHCCGSAEGRRTSFQDLRFRSTYATRLSSSGVADKWVTQLLCQGDSKVFKKYSQMKLAMKREALQMLNRKASEEGRRFDTGGLN
jgi:hypothetical protein